MAQEVRTPGRKSLSPSGFYRIKNNNKQQIKSQSYPGSAEAKQ